MKSFFLFCVYFVCFLHSPGFTPSDSIRSYGVPYQAQVGSHPDYTRSQTTLEANNDCYYSGEYFSGYGRQNVLDLQRNQEHTRNSSSDRFQGTLYQGSGQQQNFGRGQCLEGDNSAFLGVPVYDNPNPRGLDARRNIESQQGYQMPFNNNVYPFQMRDAFMKKILSFASEENLMPVIEKADSVNRIKASLKFSFNGQSIHIQLKQIDVLSNDPFSLSFLNQDEHLFTNFCKTLFLIKQNSEGYFLFKLKPIFVWNTNLGNYSSGVVFWMEFSTARMWIVHNTTYDKGSVSVNAVLPVYVNQGSPFYKESLIEYLYFVDSYDNHLYFFDSFFNLIDKNVVLVKDQLRTIHDFTNTNNEKLWINLWI